MPAKVLHLITHLGIGGAQDNTLLTVQKHDRSKYIVHLASHPDGAWSDRAKAVTDEFHPIPELVHPLHPLRDMQCLFRLVKLLRQEKFDVVHTHSSKAGILGRWAARIAKVPVIVHTIHGFAFHDFMPAWKRQLYISLEQLASNSTDFFITVSELNRKQANQLGLLNFQNSKTIYSGIDFAKLDRDANLSSLRAELKLPLDWKVIVMVGRLDEQKATHFLIHAFAQVVQRLPKTLLVLVGNGNLYLKLVQQTQRLGISDKVKFLGEREDIPEILKLADIFALSSLWEGLGRAMTEAMLLGKPVVVPNIYGIPEIVHHQQTGLLFPAGDVDQLAAHLIYLLQNPAQCARLGDNAQQLTRHLFDVNQMVEQIEAVYAHLL